MCDSEGFTFLDLHKLIVDSTGQLPADFSADGVHPNAKGYAAIAPAVRAAINAASRLLKNSRGGDAGIFAESFVAYQSRIDFQYALSARRALKQESTRNAAHASFSATR